ncbi:MAG: FAD-dependent oxidoreductase [Bdellovibrionaceae bacterium]|nr:FAD-dependent oxidoreductase [Pseudobdellovibrionaceae bacterium]
MKQITVVGAGFSGLTIARALLKKGFQVTIREKTSRAGGLIETIQTPFGLAEKAAPSVTRTPRMDRLLEELKVQTLEPSKASKKRLFYVSGLTRWPLSVIESLALGFNLLWSKLTGRLAPRPHETIRAWGERCLTKAATHRLVATAFQGIYAGNANRMSASLILGPLFSKSKRDPYVGVTGVEGGMSRFMQALEQDVKNRGGRFEFENPVSSELPENCVLAVPCSEASRILAVKDPALSELLSQVEEAPLVTATVFFEEPTGPNAFGCLVPRGAGPRVLGVLLNHAIFPGRDPKFSETWIYGGATDPDLVTLSKEEILKSILLEREILFGKTNAPLHSEITIWKKGLPHYDLVLEEVLQKISEPKGLWLHGNWAGSIGLSRILERSDALAERIAKELN